MRLNEFFHNNLQNSYTTYLPQQTFYLMISVFKMAWCVFGNWKQLCVFLIKFMYLFCSTFKICTFYEGLCKDRKCLMCTWIRMYVIIFGNRTIKQLHEKINHALIIHKTTKSIIVIESKIILFSYTSNTYI